VKDFVEAVLQICRDFGVYAPDWAVPYVIVSMVLSAALVPAWLAVRRWRGDFQAVSGELRAATKLISEDTTQRLADVTDRLERRLTGKLDAIHEVVKTKYEVSANGTDHEVQETTGVDAPKKTFRLKSATSVADRVLEKWQLGTLFRMDPKRPGCFNFEGTNEQQQIFRVALLTPYRADYSSGTDKRMAFALDVWVDNKKKLNFEWNSEGEYALRGFTKGDWIEDLAEWRVKPIISQPQTQTQTVAA
jgi:hypothetical protein